LTDWLHELFQSVAARTIKDDPVTFGHLWGTDDELAERDIDLVLMTTNATRGVSHRFPFVESVWGPLYFNEYEFAKLFPPRVVECLVNPEQAPEEKAKREEANNEKGLTSNFPIHFFDAPIPSRPTFGINLVPDTVTGGEKGAEPELEARRSPVAVAKDPWLNVWMPTTNSTGIQDVALFHDVASGPWAVIDFFMMLFDTARNWGDTELLAMPGYRDRIVHVALADNEGGLNLSMPPETVRAIGERRRVRGHSSCRTLRIRARTRRPRRRSASPGTITAGLGTELSWRPSSWWAANSAPRGSVAIGPKLSRRIPNSSRNRRATS